MNPGWGSVEKDLVGWTVYDFGLDVLDIVHIPTRFLKSVKELKHGWLIFHIKQSFTLMKQVLAMTFQYAMPWWPSISHRKMWKTYGYRLEFWKLWDRADRRASQLSVIQMSGNPRIPNEPVGRRDFNSWAVCQYQENPGKISITAACWIYKRQFWSLLKMHDNWLHDWCQCSKHKLSIFGVLVLI